MGKVRRVSDILPLWLIASITCKDLLFKGGRRDIRVSDV